MGKPQTEPVPIQGAEAGPDILRRSIRSPLSSIADVVTGQDIVAATLIGGAIALLVMPWLFISLVPILLLFYLWATSRKYRLSYRVPIMWGGPDYSTRTPGGGKGYRRAEGIMFLGNEYENNQQLWITNSDARRHVFVLGTTGAGKALPADALVLTPGGWVRNGDLRPGDIITHQSGSITTVTGIYPQGAQNLVRVEFADGRVVDCTHDHLWDVKLTGNHGIPDAKSGAAGERRVMRTADLGVLLGLKGESLRAFAPFFRPHSGLEPPEELTPALAARLAREGLHSIEWTVDIHGSPASRRTFLRNFAETREVSCLKAGLRIPAMDRDEAVLLKHLVWSLGGTAVSFRSVSKAWFVDFNLPDIGEMVPGVSGVEPIEFRGLEIVSVEPLEASADCVCIRTGRDDGLYVTDGYVVTHNTEVLLGMVSQALMWSSGFIFIDGKGTTEFYARTWSLARRFGREDDVRVINFTGGSSDPDAPSGSAFSQSNTLNPFAKGSPDQLTNLIISLMGDAGGGNDMWKKRAMSLVSGLMRALCDLRDSGSLLLDVQAIRDFLPLGQGVVKRPGVKPAAKAQSINDLTDEQWKDIRSRAGMIEIYLRALKGDFSSATALNMKAFFDTLPGFSLEKALNGDPQDTKASEQYGFLSMQLTGPLSSLADDFGHIFRTPLGEVDMADIVYNRRILVVLLPALQKAPEMMKNCGTIIISMIKMMMGLASGSDLEGSKKTIIDAKPTRAPSPFILVADEVGYYMVDGLDVMMAQGRSLGFCIIPAGQDMAAMGKISPQIAESVSANARLLVIGATEDAAKTFDFINKKIARKQVAVSSGYTSRPGLVSNRYVDRMDVSFQEVEQVKINELQSLQEGEFYYLFEGILAKSRTFYIGGDFIDNFRINKFVKVRGPTDKVPGLDQSVDIAFIDGFVAAGRKLAEIEALPKGVLEAMDSIPGGATPEELLPDGQGLATVVALRQLAPAQAKSPWTAAVMALGLLASNDEDDIDESEIDFDIEIDESDMDDGENSVMFGRDSAHGVHPQPHSAGNPADVDATPRRSIRPAGPVSVEPMKGRRDHPERSVAADFGHVAGSATPADKLARLTDRLLEERMTHTGAERVTMPLDALPRQEMSAFRGLVGELSDTLARMETLMTSDPTRGEALGEEWSKAVLSASMPVELAQQDPEAYMAQLDKLASYLSEG